MGKKRAVPDFLFQRWLHSREEDTATERVYRPAAYPFPPSRGRPGFELRRDGTFVEIGIGPTDRPLETGPPGSWELASDGRLMLRRPRAGGAQPFTVGEKKLTAGQTD